MFSCTNINTHLLTHYIHWRYTRPGDSMGVILHLWPSLTSGIMPVHTTYVYVHVVCLGGLLSASCSGCLCVCCCLVCMYVACRPCAPSHSQQQIHYLCLLCTKYKQRQKHVQCTYCKYVHWATLCVTYIHDVVSMNAPWLRPTFHMKLPPNPTGEEMAYAEKWSYVIQLRYVCTHVLQYIHSPPAFIPGIINTYMLVNMGT